MIDFDFLKCGVYINLIFLLLLFMEKITKVLSTDIAAYKFDERAENHEPTVPSSRSVHVDTDKPPRRRHRVCLSPVLILDKGWSKYPVLIAD